MPGCEGQLMPESAAAPPMLFTPLAVAIFLGRTQQTWLEHFPDMSRRAQGHIAAFLCVRHRTGCQFGELSGHIKQIFLLDDATIKERVRAAAEAGLVTIEPEPLSARAVILAAAPFLEAFDRFLVATARDLNTLTAARGQIIHVTPERLDKRLRLLLADVAACHYEPLQNAIDIIGQEIGLSRARSLEARRQVLSLSHAALIRLALVHHLEGHDGVLADDLAAQLLALTRQNFQTTRDHINYLLSIGLLARRPGKMLHVTISEAAARHLRVALADMGEILRTRADELAAMTLHQPTAEATLQRRQASLSTRPDTAVMHELIVTGPDMAPQRLELTSSTTVIGRTAPSAVMLPGHNISRTHCRIDIEAGRATLTDLNSTNGTMLDGRILAGPQALETGAKITLGDYTLLYHYRPSPRTNQEIQRLKGA